VPHSRPGRDDNVIIHAKNSIDYIKDEKGSINTQAIAFRPRRSHRTPIQITVHMVAEMKAAVKENVPWP